MQSLFDDEECRRYPRLFGAMNSHVGDLPSLPGIFPDYPAPIVRNSAGEREIVMARWGMPTSQFARRESAKKRATKLEAKGQHVDFNEMLRMQPDSGVTNIRNTSSMHWQRWLRPENRCLVPFTSFSEYDTIEERRCRSGLRSTRAGPCSHSLASGRTGPACAKRRVLQRPLPDR